jgi:hypothetical protein
VRDAARAAGLSERTAARRAGDPAFRARVNALRGEVVSAAVGQLAALLVDATGALRRALTCGSAAVEVRAALGIIDHLLKVREQTELEERLRTLEQRMAGKQ